MPNERTVYLAYGDPSTSPTDVTIAAPLPIAMPVTVATLTSVASAITSSVLLATNTARKSFVIYNESTSVLFVAFAATASATAYTVQVLAGGTFVPPANLRITGVISGIWTTANGFARITELA